jgi:uncharacterized protein (DUF1499 family)
MRHLAKFFMLTALLLFVLNGCAGDRPKNLGVRDGRLLACPASPNCVQSQGADEQHRIAPLAFTGEPDAALARLKRTLSGRGDTKIIEEKPDYLRVEFHTTLFTDDCEFLLERGLHAFQLRSASRLGHSDLGKNRSRIEEIRREFASQQQ